MMNPNSCDIFQFLKYATIFDEAMNYGIDMEVFKNSITIDMGKFIFVFTFNKENKEGEVLNFKKCIIEKTLSSKVFLMITTPDVILILQYVSITILFIGCKTYSGMNLWDIFDTYFCDS